MGSSPEQSFLLPRHIAIIMDGNGRWARKRLLPRIEGHRRGAGSVRRAVEFCRRRGIEVLTLYAFSTENWQRPQTEVSGLMSLLSEFLESQLDEIHENDIRVATIGDLSRIPPKLVERIDAAKRKTGGNRSMVLNVALSYGGRQEIIRAVKRCAEELRFGRLDPDDITEERFAGFLDTAGLPEPDLLIRTGGELRISNFLLWQSAYTELYFTSVLWPDFDDAEFERALDSYQSRQRRYGKTSDQVTGGSV